jgi:hypothetical protein
MLPGVAKYKMAWVSMRRHKWEGKLDGDCRDYVADPLDILL